MKLIKIALLAVFLGGTMSAQAGPVFNYEGVCEVGNCGALGLSNGDAVGGYIELTDDALADMIVGAGEITDYVMSFGSQVLTSANSNVIGALTTAAGGFELLPGLGAEALIFSLRGFGGIANFGITGGVDIGGLSLEGWAASDPCGLFCSPLAGGSGGYSAVPEPGVLALMAIGLASLGFTRRNKRATS